MQIVIDMNILVSALWSKNGAPVRIISMIINGSLVPCYDYRILSEYREVLRRPKFRFSNGEINSLLDWMESSGRPVVVDPIEESFIDEADKKFYEAAKFCQAKLITGNIKHFPQDPCIPKPWILSCQTENGML